MSSIKHEIHDEAQNYQVRLKPKLLTVVFADTWGDGVSKRTAQVALTQEQLRQIAPKPVGMEEGKVLYESLLESWLEDGVPPFGQEQPAGGPTSLAKRTNNPREQAWESKDKSLKLVVFQQPTGEWCFTVTEWDGTQHMVYHSFLMTQPEEI